MPQGRIQTGVPSPKMHISDAHPATSAQVPPIFEDGDLLIDGGYLNNIPVDVMHAQGGSNGAHLFVLGPVLKLESSLLHRTGDCEHFKLCAAVHLLAASRTLTNKTSKRNPGLQGVDKVLVVDVEDRDDSAWRVCRSSSPKPVAIVCVCHRCTRMMHAQQGSGDVRGLLSTQGVRVCAEYETGGRAANVGSDAFQRRPVRLAPAVGSPVPLRASQVPHHVSAITKPPSAVARHALFLPACTAQGLHTSTGLPAI